MKGDRVQVLSSGLNFFSNLFYCFNGIHMFNDLEGGSKTKLHCHQKMVVLNKTQSFPINFMLEKFVHVCFVAKSCEKLADILYCP